MMSFGTPAGVSTPNQVERSYPGSPDSPSVGIDGINDARFALVTASGLSLPTFSRGSADVRVEKLMSISPAATATTYSDAPLYGTCTIFALAIQLKSSAARCTTPPTPLVP